MTPMSSCGCGCLCPAVERLGHYPQEPRPARDRHYPSRLRSIKQPGSFALRRALRIRPGNGSLRNGRYARSPTSRRPSDGRRPHLCSPVCAFHAGRNCRRSAGSWCRPQSRSRAAATTGSAQAIEWASCGGGGKLPGPSSKVGPRRVAVGQACAKNLVEQMVAITSEDEAAAWAHRNIPATCNRSYRHGEPADMRAQKWGLASPAG
jgi:hypothetical protein